MGFAAAQKDYNAITVRDVTVSYRSYKERPTSLKEALIRIVREGKWRHYSTFDALSGVNFELRKGEVLGLIGSNGSGKSTLLKVIARVLAPTKGDVTVSGPISSLIELGAGFDPELNAVENIFLNASLHKKTRAQIKSRIDHILEFAELKDFAHTPVKYYSSGMYARLGFAVAIDIDPDILLVDEILAVGDERFQEKCNHVFERFLKEGKTIIIVSHTMSLIETMCSKALLLARGEVAYYGDPHEAVKLYRDGSYQTRLQAE